jgi:hypothetical protein
MRWIKLSVILASALMSPHTGLCQTSSTNQAVAKFYFEEVVNRQRLEGLNKVFANTFLAHSLMDSTAARKTITDQSDFLKLKCGIFQPRAASNAGSNSTFSVYDLLISSPASAR